MPTQGAVLVDDAAVFVHHLDGDDALRSGQRDGDAGVHVLGDFGGDAAQGLDVFGGRGRRRGGSRRGARCGRGAAVVRLFEDVFPAFVHGRAVVQVLLIELVFEPAIDAKFRTGLEGHGAGRPSYSSYRAFGGVRLRATAVAMGYTAIPASSMAFARAAPQVMIGNPSASSSTWKS